MRSKNKDRLVSMLNSICEFLDNYFDINAGGCCYVSYIIAKNLERLDLPYNLIIYSSDFTEEEIEFYSKEITDSISNRKNEGYGIKYDVCNHYCIEFNNVIINKRCCDKNNIYVKIKNIPSKDIKWIYDTGDWNTMYEKLMNSFVNSFIKLVFDIYKFQLK